MDITKLQQNYTIYKGTSKTKSSSHCNTSRSSSFILLRNLDYLISNSTECGMEFQTEKPILAKDFIVFPFLEIFTEKHSFVDDLVL